MVRVVLYTIPTVLELLYSKRADSWVVAKCEFEHCKDLCNS